MPRDLMTRALRSVGWEFEGELPEVPKCVILAAPHTSNWDGLLLLSISHSIGLEMSWMIKASWLKGPLGPVMRRLGAVAVERGRASNMVGQMIEEFERRDRFVLIIPPEGTRGRAEHWKSGFYHIARGANVPVIPGYLDYGNKRCGLGPPVYLTGDVRADMDEIRAFYAAGNYRGMHPEQFGPIRLREEDDAAAGGQG